MLGQGRIVYFGVLTVRIMNVLIEIEIAEKKDEEEEEKEEEFGVDLDAEDNETDFGWLVSFIPYLSKCVLLM